jgi:calcineurin-like phosphoesterase family protein
MSKTFVISDTHYSHVRIMDFYPKQRPFSSIEDMNNKMILAWNSVVNPEDTVFHLGDFSFGTEQKARSVFERLNGKINIIWGNHDKVSKKLKFESTHDYYELNYEKQKVILFHYPIQEWDGIYKDVVHLHGHIHSINGFTGSGETRHNWNVKNRYDVGVENIGLAPILLDKAIKLAKNNG